MSNTRNSSYAFKSQVNEFGKIVFACTGCGEYAVVPQNTSVISDDLFKGHKELKKVRLPDTLNQLGGFVFDGCTNLQDLVLPNGLEDMWQYALTRCGIKQLTIPGSIRCVVPFTCFECEQLETVTIEQGVLNISGFAFKNCYQLKDVYVPDSVTDINKHAFDGCPNVVLHRI